MSDVWAKLQAYVKLHPSIFINILGGIGMVLTGAGIVGEPDWLKYQAIAQALLNLFLPSPLTPVVNKREAP